MLIKDKKSNYNGANKAPLLKVDTNNEHRCKVKIVLFRKNRYETSNQTFNYLSSN